MNFLKKIVNILIICLLWISINSRAEGELYVEKINIDAHLKNRVMHSTLKADMQRNDGKKIVAYLHAEDEVNKKIESYSCSSGELSKSTSKTGHFYIYLYDVMSNSFFPFRTKILSDSEETTFGVEGADLIVLPGGNLKKSDVLIIGQFGFCYTNFYEAYGFSENGLYLKNYTFVNKRHHNDLRFNGLIYKGREGDKQMAYIAHNVENSHMFKFSLNLSIKDEKIHLHPEKFD